ncbi:glycoside hydrolase family 88 protein [Afipia birgiae]|uniref:glycoside hydrolase family 88 protein n=1 Tax=Afipia birgiae TaxID=151414 RepID=UPI0002D6D33D|nr:glycoside hydrolase family 88 protein [Afipia birgiae]
MDIDALICRVTEFTLAHPDERDCWTKATAITGLLADSDPAVVAAADRWLQHATATQRSNGHLNYSDAVQGVGGHIRSFTPTASLSASLGYPLLLRYRQNRDASYLEAARRQMEALRNSPRTSDGGIWARAEGPELWIDFTHLMCPFMALYGQIASDQSAIDEAFAQYRVHVAHLLDPHKHLARHAWCEKPDHFTQSTFWSRGNGWLVCASVDLLTIAPDHPEAQFVAATCSRVLNAMAPYQDATGYFCHVLDEPRSNLEASGTLMFAYAVACGVRLGVVAATLMPAAIKAFRTVAQAVEPAGKVPGVAVPPGGPGVPFDWTLFGQGFFLLAARELKNQLS